MLLRKRLCLHFLNDPISSRWKQQCSPHSVFLSLQAEDNKLSPALLSLCIPQYPGYHGVCPSAGKSPVCYNSLELGRCRTPHLFWGHSMKFPFAHFSGWIAALTSRVLSAPLFPGKVIAGTWVGFQMALDVWYVWLLRSESRKLKKVIDWLVGLCLFFLRWQHQTHSEHISWRMKKKKKNALRHC